MRSKINKELEKVRSVMTEMLLKAVPKTSANEAIAKRLENPLKILLPITIKYQPEGRREREAALSKITNPKGC